MPLRLSKDNRVYNIRIQKDGRDRDHINIKQAAFKNLAQLIYTIDVRYPCHFDLDANVADFDCYTGEALSEQFDPMVAIRHEELNYAKIFAQQYQGHACEYSEQQKEAFKKRYNQEITDKFGGGNSWLRIAPNYIWMVFSELNSSWRST